MSGAARGPHPLQTLFWRACEEVIWRHCAPWELDEALCEWGYGLGPCEAMDLAGLDRVLAARGADRGPVLPRMVAEGRLGKAAGWGFYRYPGGGGAVIDPLIDDLVREEAWFAKAEQKELSHPALVAQVHAQCFGAISADLGAAAALLHYPSPSPATPS